MDTPTTPQQTRSHPLYPIVRDHLAEVRRGVAGHNVHVPAGMGNVYVPPGPPGWVDLGKIRCTNPKRPCPRGAEFWGLNPPLLQTAAAIDRGGGPLPIPGGGGTAVGTTVSDSFSNMVIDSQWYQRRGTWTELRAGTTGYVQGFNSTGNPAAMLMRIDKQPADTQNTAVVIVQSGDLFAGLIACSQGYTGALSGYICYYDTTDIYLDRYTNDVGTNLSSNSVPMNPGDLFEIQVTGGQVIVRVNGVDQLTVADATYTSGYAGLVVAGTGVTAELGAFSIQ